MGSVSLLSPPSGGSAQKTASLLFDAVVCPEILANPFRKGGLLHSSSPPSVIGFFFRFAGAYVLPSPTVKTTCRG